MKSGCHRLCHVPVINNKSMCEPVRQTAADVRIKEKWVRCLADANHTATG